MSDFITQRQVWTNFTDTQQVWKIFTVTQQVWKNFKLSNKFERHYQLGKKFETNLKHKLIHEVKHVLCFSINRMLIYNDIYHRMIDISICTIPYTLRKTIDFIVSWLVIQSVYIVNTLSTHTRLRLTKKFQSLLTS